jgi:hypothetical protein
MKKTYTSAMGKPIDMDNIRLSNENTIAIGNMKVNARGDELGPNGNVIKTRNQVMDEYYRLNTPAAMETSEIQADDWEQPQVKEILTPLAFDSSKIANQNQSKTDAKPLIQSSKKSN